MAERLHYDDLPGVGCRHVVGGVPWDTRIKDSIRGFFTATAANRTQTVLVLLRDHLSADTGITFTLVMTLTALRLFAEDEPA